MYFRTQYQNMNEKIAPNAALTAATLARIQQDRRPRREFRARRLVAAMVIAAALTAGITPALAANVPEVYRTLYTLSPALADRLTPVHAVCEAQGVRLEVVSAYVEGDRALVTFTLRDLTGAYFQDAPPELFDHYTMESDRPSLQDYCAGSTVTPTGYDPATRTATYLAQLEGKPLAGDRFTFTIHRLLTGGRQHQECTVPVDLSAVPLNAPTASRPIVAAFWSESVQGDPIQTQAVYTFLTPQEQPLWQSADGVFSLSAVGYRDGQLHLLYAAAGAAAHDNSGWFPLHTADGTLLSPAYRVEYLDEETGTRYSECVYDLPYAQAAGCTLSARMTTSGALLEGDWRVTFRLDEHAAR